ncbi:hypothetical protein E6P09_11155 [Haloferax mediterranei ATCC 33500]|uniref:DUF8097 domain-containing protein n=1 Tax=Haloferax mediterranei (strain ATCC 33500 / DSM 1411 / JCM 8866 / NBRC 14739 / NCIMB 2177 / R-4) TaxID=523841 RepID=M0J9U5_HALMT|nr:hypothetical protein [Haloferax mediterranei]AHZ21315.1 hypothetical protein BM92_00990 [Haloferax mediterranei ATCC 33500]EMA04480.1 hypothetical protein C439_02357 [Haloferax mediterranei ATCC 33500]MDX5989434.1 hypothetical protein [Haloferax mediterranei ATCC 33500]QCQ75798.1 hypothetical protein E6P09_11155 [Haloferax mediterranei ATCC 33500]
MVTRRTKALVQLGLSLLASLWMLLLRKIRQDSEDEQHAPARLSLVGLVAGGVRGVGHLWANDRDFWQIRTSRRRRFLASLVTTTVDVRLSSRSESFNDSFALGHLLGATVYRAWFGLLRPLPEADG